MSLYITFLSQINLCEHHFGILFHVLHPTQDYDVVIIVHNSEEFVAFPFHCRVEMATLKYFMVFKSPFT